MGSSKPEKEGISLSNDRDETANPPFRPYAPFIETSLLHGERDHARTRHLVSLRPAPAPAATASA